MYIEISEMCLKHITVIEKNYIASPRRNYWFKDFDYIEISFMFLSPLSLSLSLSIAKFAVFPRNWDTCKLIISYVLKVCHIACIVIDWKEYTEIFYVLPMIKLC